MGKERKCKQRHVCGAKMPGEADQAEEHSALPALQLAVPPFELAAKIAAKIAELIPMSSAAEQAEKQEQKQAEKQAGCDHTVGDGQQSTRAFVEMGKNLKSLRRELNFMKSLEQQLREEIQKLKVSRGHLFSERNEFSALCIIACQERDAAVAERDRATSECDVVVAARDVAVAQCEKLQQSIKNYGKTVEKLDEEELKILRAELQAALDIVDTWGAAQESVAKECPDLCCPLSLHTQLMHDPVLTPDDGRTYERAAIEKHFDRLQREKLPPMSPQKLPLKSTLLVPNVMAKTHIVAMVQKKSMELTAGAKSKRMRKD